LKDRSEFFFLLELILRFFLPFDDKHFLFDRVCKSVRNTGAKIILFGQCIFLFMQVFSYFLVLVYLWCTLFDITMYVLHMRLYFFLCDAISFLSLHPFTGIPLLFFDDKRKKMYAVMWLRQNFSSKNAIVSKIHIIFQKNSKQIFQLTNQKYARRS